jgi:hypothetical protein
MSAFASGQAIGLKAVILGDEVSKAMDSTILGSFLTQTG